MWGAGPSHDTSYLRRKQQQMAAAGSAGTPLHVPHTNRHQQHQATLTYIYAESDHLHAH